MDNFSRAQNNNSARPTGNINKVFPGYNPGRISDEFDIQMALPGFAEELAKYAQAILPYWATVTNTFSVALDTKELTLNVDNSYYFFISGVSVYKSTADTNVFINSISIDTLTNMLKNPIRFNMITQFTSWPMAFYVPVPAGSYLTAEVINGTTADQTVDITYWGSRAPRKLVEQIIDKLKKTV